MSKDLQLNIELKEIINIINMHKEVLSKNYDVKSIGIFGSFVRNEQKENSDIDILVEFSCPIGLKFFTLENYLSEMLGIKVDLVTKRALKSAIKDEILEEVIEI